MSNEFMNANTYIKLFKYRTHSSISAVIVGLGLAENRGAAR